MQLQNWSDLQVFLAIARAGQLTRAGSSLGIDGTTVGRRLRRLESRLGATLFEQTREGQILTEAGEDLLARVEQMAAVAAGIAEGATGEPRVAGHLRITVSEGFGSWFLARHVPKLAESYPDLTVDFVSSSGFLSLSKREADIAVTLSRPRSGPVIARKLASYALRLYASKSYLACHSAPASAADLAAGHRLVSYIPDMLYAPELNYLDEFQPGLTPRLRSQSINAQHQFLAAGAGIGVLPCFIGDGDPRLVPVLPDRCIERTFWLVLHKDTNQLARILAGKNWIMETVKEFRHLLLPC